MPSIWTAVGIFRISPSMVMVFSTISGKAWVAPMLSKRARMSWLRPWLFRSRKKPASAAMKRFGGVFATKRLTRGLSPAVSCGTEAATMVLPVVAVNLSTMVLSAAISLSLDQL
jgi:hypothetical protein